VALTAVGALLVWVDPLGPLRRRANTD